MDELLDLIGEGAGWVASLGVSLGVASAFNRKGKPMVKSAIKAYLAASDRAKVAAAVLAEDLQDLYAEAKMEHDAGRSEVTQSPLP